MRTMAPSLVIEDLLDRPLPDLALPDHTGASFALRSRVGRGSLVLFFYLLNGTPT